MRRPGSAWLSHDDPTYAELRAEIRAAKAQADLLVVMPHWGIEYEDRPRDVEVAAAHAMVEAGADLIIGDHPHWVQSVELYQGAYVIYGIGNFVFDQMWSTETREGSLQRLSFVGSRLVAVRIMPTLIEDFFQPIDIHGLVQAIANGFLHERMIGYADRSVKVFAAGHLVGKNRRKQIVRPHTLNLWWNLSAPLKAQQGKRAIGVPSPASPEDG